MRSKRKQNTNPIRYCSFFLLSLQYCPDTELCRATSPLKIRQAKDTAISILKKMEEEYATELDCIEKEELEFYIGNIEAAYERYKSLLIQLQ